jgi:predicted alpha/beta superfamily hydrolase
MTKFFTLIPLFLTLISCHTPPPESSVLNVASGKVERIEQFPTDLVTPRTIDIWLPEGYSTQKSYAVLYMHDGDMLFDSTITWNKQEWGVDETCSQLLQAGKIQDCIVVGIWNSGPERHSDYFPQKAFDLLPAPFRDSLLQEGARSSGELLYPAGIRSDKYLRFLVEELKPFIDATYATRTEKEYTFIAGSSMGGLISLYALCEYPEVFQGAACLSTHWPGIFTLDNNPIPEAFYTYLAQSLPNPATHQIYFDYGTETLDALYEPCQKTVDQILVEQGWQEPNWITRKFEGHDHSERSWQRRLDIPLQFLLGTR